MIRGTCDVMLQAKEQYATDMFKLASIYTTAYAVTTDCLISGSEVGGKLDVGLQHVFKIVVDHHELFEPDGTLQEAKFLYIRYFGFCASFW